jgi:hypothetical protein
MASFRSGTYDGDDQNAAVEDRLNPEGAPSRLSPLKPTTISRIAITAPGML